MLKAKGAREDEGEEGVPPLVSLLLHFPQSKTQHPLCTLCAAHQADHREATLLICSHPYLVQSSYELDSSIISILRGGN